MDDLAGEESFIRSMATRGHSGGLALAVPAAIQLFDAVGYEPVIIETVGVGQVEVDVAGAADTTVVVVTPGMGDAVQANKAGLLEVADIFVVNKSDRPGASDARRDLELMLDLGHVSGLEDMTGYRPPIIMANSLDGTGADEVLEAIKSHAEFLRSSGKIAIRRKERLVMEIQNRIELLSDQQLVSLLNLNWELASWRKFLIEKSRQLKQRNPLLLLSPRANNRYWLTGTARPPDRTTT